MKDTDTLFTLITGGFVSTVAYLVGGIDNLAKALGILMVLDYGTGIASALYLGNLQSNKAYKGLAKKTGAIAFVILANQMDIITGNDNGFLRNAMMFFLIGMEGISIKENAQKMGITAPQLITDTLNKFIGKKADQNQTDQPGQTIQEDQKGEK